MSVALIPSLGFDLTVTDFFCGAGGGSEGLRRAGFRILTAANHWQTAVDTHAMNHPDTEHLCKDINNYDMRRLKRSRVLWASVICTEASQAGGNRTPPNPEQLALMQQGPIAKEAWQRTRACAYDVIRAAEIWQYDAIIVENVVEFITRWPLFNWWASAWELLGYNLQIASISAAHIGDEGNDPAAQWRDRIFIVITRKGIPLPDLAPRPQAWCPVCTEDVAAVQSWRDTPLLRRMRYQIGKYRVQYDYRCPNDRCKHTVVEPYVSPASSIIDWCDLGVPIGDRAALRLPILVKNTRDRIRAGITKHYPADRASAVPLMITVNHSGEDGDRAQKVTDAPFPTRTVKRGDGMVIPAGAFIDVARNHGTGISITSPTATLSTARHHGLVIPYRRANAKPVSDPLLTLATKDSASLVVPDSREFLEVTEEDIDRCLYRMFTPRESLRGQRFYDDYVVTGNAGEQQIQAGNAVAVNCSQWVGGRVRAALEGAA